MSKTMCEMDKNERKDRQEDAKFICKKCQAVARKEKHLCKPKKIKDQHSI